jgi:hypothetical protein
MSEKKKKRNDKNFLLQPIIYSTIQHGINPCNEQSREIRYDSTIFIYLMS